MYKQHTGMCLWNPKDMTYKFRATTKTSSSFQTPTQTINSVDTVLHLVATTFFQCGQYKCETNGVPVTALVGSTTPLVEKLAPEDEEMGYNPFEHRKLSHPTSDMDTLIHLLKGSLGSGILAMPLAFYNSGLLFGVLATFVIGFICTYCVHVLVKCAHILCRRTQVPSLGFAEIAEAAFLAGPPAVQRLSGVASATINWFLGIDLLGCCCVYIVFVAKNLKQVVDFYTDDHWDLRIYMVLMMPVLIAINMVRNLKYLAPLSMIANLLIATGLAITFYYIFSDMPALETRPNFSTWHQLPLFFGTAIFALEGIGVVMPLENNMKTPTHFVGCPGVLNIGMFVVVTLYTSVGFFGYLKYGDETKGSITLNLPTEEKAKQGSLPMHEVCLYQFLQVVAFLLNTTPHKTNRVGIAAAIPNLGPFISLVGAVCLSTLGIMFPAIIELVTFWEDPGLGRFNWVLWKNLAIILFGVLGFVTGTYSSIDEIVREFGTNIE
uniref:Amino acid transporter transmembrane domain-containing protein n=1 Tax=Timema tahoe TaxID=61484 RepID=A0A7R9IEW7_9NEOP|nr:unnamed protein product [Timema tahoe]